MKVLARILIGAAGIVAAMAISSMSAQAAERRMETKRPIIACEDRQLILAIEPLVQSGDDPAFRRYLSELIKNPSCKFHHAPTGIYVEQFDALDKGLKLGFQSALSQAFGFNIPSPPAIVRIREEGDTVYRYTLLLFLL